MGTKRKQVLTLLKPFRKQLILSFLLTVILTVLGMASPLLMRSLINDVAGLAQWDLFPLIVMGMFALPVLTQGVNVFNSLILNRVGIGIIGTTRRRLFAHLMEPLFVKEVVA